MICVLLCRRNPDHIRTNEYLAALTIVGGGLVTHPPSLCTMVAIENHTARDIDNAKRQIEVLSKRTSDQDQIDGANNSTVTLTFRRASPGT